MCFLSRDIAMPGFVKSALNVFERRLSVANANRIGDPKSVSILEAFSMMASREFGMSSGNRMWKSNPS